MFEIPMRQVQPPVTSADHWKPERLPPKTAGRYSAATNLMRTIHATMMMVGS
jgi:hypothetical protein